VIWDTKHIQNQYGKICFATVLFVWTNAKHISLSAANVYHLKTWHTTHSWKPSGFHMPPSGIIQKASIQRHKYLVISNLPLQGVSIISCISLYKTQPTAYMTHQLMKDDFPAEWLPIRRTTIFFRGASRLRLNCSAILIKPERLINEKQTVENKGSFQVEFCSINLLWKNY